MSARMLTWISIDLKKAFDNVNHKILVEFFFLAGIQGSVNKIIIKLFKYLEHLEYLGEGTT